MSDRPVVEKWSSPIRPSPPSSFVKSWEPIEIEKIMRKAKLVASFEPVQVFIQPDIRQTQHTLISYKEDPNFQVSLTQSEKYPYMEKIQEENFVAYVSPCNEFRRDNQAICQDAIAIKKEGDEIQIAVADGISSSFFSHIAAQTACSVFLNNPKGSLPQTVLENASEHLKSMHTQLEKVETGYEVLDAALENIRQYGSETTFNQFSINTKTGRVTGLFLGNGGFAIIHYPSGVIETYQCGSDKNRLATSCGIRGEAGTLESVVNGELFLEKGDSFLCYSDGVEPMLSEVVQILQASPPKSQELITDLLDKGPTDIGKDDDRSLIIVQMP